MKRKNKLYDIVGAFIKDQGNRILFYKRTQSDEPVDAWGFPSSKVEMHENKKEALKRELKKELGIDVKVGRLINRFEDDSPEMKIYMYLFACSLLNDPPQSIRHQDVKWATLGESKNLNLTQTNKKITGYLERRRIK